MTDKKTDEPVVKLHDIEKSMILETSCQSQLAGSGCGDETIPERVGEEMQRQGAPKGRFGEAKSFAIGSDTKAIAVAYYTALGEKNIEAVKKYVHPDIQFADPQETVMGKETFLKAAKRFSAIFKTLTICAQFGSEDQALIVYDLEVPGLPKKIRAASWLRFREGLISNVEIIYDTRCLANV